MIRLFSPLIAIRYPRYDLEDLNGEGGGTLTGRIVQLSKRDS